MTAPAVRPARPEDAEAIATFTRGTFSWGDYVSDQFEEWLTDERGRVLVAVDSDDRAVAIVRILMLSEHEAWLHAARVHPDHRRMGLGRRLNEAGCDWARERGALVARLMVEDWNDVARRQVERGGYHRTAAWCAAHLELGSEVVPQSNGGRRVPGEERLTPGRATEADMAWMAWASSELARAGRELFPLGWHVRRMRPADLTDAAIQRRLWHCPSGWAIVNIDQGDMDVPWVATSDLDVARLIRAIVDLADGSRVEHVRLMTPCVDWMTTALESAGFAISSNTVYAKPL